MNKSCAQKIEQQRHFSDALEQLKKAIRSPIVKRVFPLHSAIVMQTLHHCYSTIYLFGGGPLLAHYYWLIISKIDNL